MKKCTNCGKEYPDDAARYLIDEEPLSGGEIVTPVVEEAVVRAPPVAALPKSVLSDRQMEIIEVILVCVIAFGVSIISSAYIFFHGEYDHTAGNLAWVLQAVREVSCLGLIWYLLQRRGNSFYNLGLTWSWKDVGWSVVLLFGASAGFYAVYSSLHEVIRVFGMTGFGSHGLERHVEKYLFGGGVFFSTILFSFINPFFEELIARAYLMTQVKRLTNSVMAAVLISTVLQTSYHFYQGGVRALSYVPVFLVFSIYYARTNRIAPIILAHLYLDVGATVAYCFRSAAA